MWATRATAVAALLLSRTPTCSAQNVTGPDIGNNVAEDPTAFSNPDYNLTTVTIEYQVHTGCGPENNLTTIRQRVSYVVFDGLAIIDGDIVYGTEEDILRDIVPDQGTTPALLARTDLLEDGASLLGKRALSTRTADARWPNAEIPYTFSNADVSAFLSDTAAEDMKKAFRDAVKIWTDRLPWLKIHEVADQTYDPEALTVATRLTISLIDGCVSWSPVGRASAQRYSVLSIGCLSVGTYVHEIGHTLGLYHEHQRADRASYFTLDCSRIEDDGGVSPVCSVPCVGWGCAFEPRKNPITDNWEGPYDTNSVMHYFEGSFGKKFSEPPLIGVTADVRVGRTEKPTIFDLTRVCEIYGEQCFGKGICGDGILSPANGEECDPGCSGGDSCTEDCKRKPVCGNGRVETGEECDDGPTGSAKCGTDCKAVTCIQTCDPDPRYNLCDQSTSCIAVEGGTAASAGKHYCACRHGFRAPLGESQMRLPWFSPVSQEGRVFVEPGQACNLLCDAWTLGRDGCKEVVESPGCY